MIERPLRVSRIQGEGQKMVLRGEYLDEGAPAHVLLDRQTFVSFWRDWAMAGHPQPIFYDAYEQTVRVA